MQEVGSIETKLSIRTEKNEFLGELTENKYEAMEAAMKVLSQNGFFRLTYFPGKFHPGYGSKEIKEKMYKAFMLVGDRVCKAAGRGEGEPGFVTLSELFYELEIDFERVNGIRRVTQKDPIFDEHDLRSWKYDLLQLFIDYGGKVTEEIDYSLVDPFGATRYEKTALIETPDLIGDPNALLRLAASRKIRESITGGLKRQSLLLHIHSFHEMAEERSTGLERLQHELKTMKQNKWPDKERLTDLKIDIKQKKSLELMRGPLV